MATRQPSDPPGRQPMVGSGRPLGRWIAERPGARIAAAITAGFLVDPPAPSRDPGQVHRAVEEVLARPEFRPAARPLLDRIWTWIVTLLGGLLADLTATTAGSIIGLALFAVILILLGLLAARFIRTMSRSPEVEAAVVARPQRSTAEWRAEAEAHEAAGEWRQAVRCRYRALVADLASRGVVEEVPGRTSGEYRGEVDRNFPDAAEAFGGATEVFDRAWYGRSPTGAGEAARFRELAGRVLERAPA
jgi:predicted lipid-binding transport protein (Tim44 family)